MSLLNFIPISKLGQGSFGTVYKVRRLTDQKIYAMKKINLTNLDLKSKNNSLNQIRILASLSEDSQNIVKYYQAIFQQKLDVLCIIMEYADAGDLSFLIKEALKKKKNIPQIQIWNVFIQILKGIKCLHEKGILHRDLKTQNIFLFENANENQSVSSIVSKKIVKIGDLNVSKVTKNQTNIAKTQTGTPYYASPQIWDDLQYNQKSDIWSIGCILYQLTCLKPPFDGKNMNQLYFKVKSGKYKEIPSFYSQQLRNLIRICLNVNPLQRKSANQLLNNFTVRMYGNLLNIKMSQPQKNNFNEDRVSSQMKKNIYQVSKSIQKNDKEFLKTIQMPLNKKLLKEKLPKSNYKSQKQNHLPANLQKQYENQSQTKIKTDNTKQSFGQSHLKKQQQQQFQKDNDVQLKSNSCENKKEEFTILDKFEIKEKTQKQLRQSQKQRQASIQKAQSKQTEKQVYITTQKKIKNRSLPKTQRSLSKKRQSLQKDKQHLNQIKKIQPLHQITQINNQNIQKNISLQDKKQQLAHLANYINSYSKYSKQNQKFSYYQKTKSNILNEQILSKMLNKKLIQNENHCYRYLHSLPDKENIYLQQKNINKYKDKDKDKNKNKNNNFSQMKQNNNPYIKQYMPKSPVKKQAFINYKNNKQQIQKSYQKHKVNQQIQRKDYYKYNYINGFHHQNHQNRKYKHRILMKQDYSQKIFPFSDKKDEKSYRERQKSNQKSYSKLKNCISSLELVFQNLDLNSIKRKAKQLSINNQLF